MASPYNQAQWQKNVRLAYSLITTPIVSTDKNGKVSITYRSWQDVKKMTGLSWATLREVSLIVQEAEEKMNETIRSGIERTDSGNDQDPLPGDSGPSGELDADIHQG